MQPRQIGLAAIALTLVVTAGGCGTRVRGAGAAPPVQGTEGSPTWLVPSGATPAPTPTATAAPTPTRPVPRPSTARPAPPRSGGKPGPANTGVPAGTALRVVQGDQVYATDNQVIGGLDIHGYVQIRARNVTLKNSIIRGGAKRCNAAVVWIRAGASARIEDSTIDPAQPNACLDGIWATGATLLRLNIRGAVDGVKAYDNVTLQDSYIHDLSWFASDPNQGGGATHNDAVQTYEGNRNVVLRHNTLLAGAKGNAAYQVTQDGGNVSTNLRIESNWLDGGGCTLNFAHKGGPTPMIGIYVIGNRFGRGSTFSCPILISTQTVLSQNSGNVWDDTGAPIPRPQQHD